jgi:protease-4
MHRITVGALVAALGVSSAAAFDFYSYWEPTPFGAGGSAAVADDAASVALNPAGLAADHGFNAYFSRYVQNVGDKKYQLFFDTPIGGIGYDAVRSRDVNVRASRFSWTYGAPVYRWFGLGGGVNRLTASKPYLTSAWTVDAGLLARPSRYLSIAAVGRNLNEPRFLRQLERPTYVAAVAVRPLWERLTLSCDVGWREGEEGEGRGDVGVRGGLSCEIVDGITLGIDADDEKNLGAGLSLGFGYGSLGYNARLDDDFKYTSDTASLGVNIERRGTVFPIGEPYPEIEVAGELAEADPGFTLLGSGRVSARNLVRRLNAARDDDDVKAVIIRVGDVEPGFGPGVSALAQEIRAAILDVRASGKKVYSYIEYAHRPQGYYIASAADVVVMPASGFFGGVGTYMTMWRITDLTERFGIEWDYAAAGDVKGTFHQIAGEPTPEMEAEVRKLVDGVYRQFLTDVASSRGLAEARVRELCEGPPLTAAACREAGLVDEVARYEDVRALVAQDAGKDEITPGEAPLPEPWLSRWGKPKAVRVIVAEGGIETGESERSFLWGSRTIGEDTLVAQLREAREDPDVGAVVLRVNSGGGSATASEGIFGEVKKCREKGMLVVASMGDVAASGGYFISCGADRIFADPATLTGSIGVVAAKPALEEFYEKYGIDRYPVKSHEHVDALSYHRHWTEEERAWVDAMMTDLYERFKGLVAEARDLDPAKVDELAGGRIYTGEQARELGLVDELGGLEDAVAYARARANLPADAPVEYVSAYGRFWVRVPDGAASPLRMEY